MDPDANLADQEWTLRELSRHYTGERLADWDARIRHATRELHDLRAALRAWLDAGGCAPDWTKAPNARMHYGR